MNANPTTSEVFAAVQEELHSAMEKFPSMNSMHEGWAVLWEEVDELWDEVKRCHLPRATEEAIQVAAMAIRFVYDLNQEGSREAEGEAGEA